MQWRGRRESQNVEDRRGQGVGSVGIKGGIGTVVLALVLWGVFGVDPRVVLNASQALPASSSAAPVQQSAQEQQTRDFVSVVLADTEDVWQQIFADQNQQYVAPKLVLFSGVVQSACGQAQSAMGPFYCPADQKVYLDMSFFEDMRRQLGIVGEQQGSGESQNTQAGDFAQAYVIAHEVAHHVQNLWGISDQVHQAQQRGQQNHANALSVQLELQADCLAGVWAYHNQQRVQFIQDGDVEEAINAATQIGDDRLQQAQQGYVVPESFTHGSSAQRVQWFKTGLTSGDVRRCDTFATRG